MVRIRARVGSKQTNHRGPLGSALTIFGCFSCRQGSRDWGKEKKGKGGRSAAEICAWAFCLL